MKGLFGDKRPVDVTIIPHGLPGDDGVYKYNITPIDAKAWVTDRIGMLRKSNGREIQYSRVFYLERSELIAVGDRIQLDDRNHEVLSVSIGKDINGRTDHKKVLTGAGF